MKPRIIFNADLCIECHACESACKNWRHTEPKVNYRKLVCIESGSFPDVKVKYKNVACYQCENAKCIDACKNGALTKNEDGIVIVDKDKCTGCRACEKACPFGVPQFGNDNIMQKCDLCSSVETEELRYPCVRMCPAKALTVVYN